MTGQGTGTGVVLALDLGSRRIGVAACDRARTLAYPLATIERGADPGADRARVAEAVAEAGATTVVVGLPLSLDGGRGPAASAALAEAGELGALLGADGVAVETFDERLTTVSATRAMAGAGKRGRAARRSVDAAAATVLLQAWLDSAAAR